MSYKPDMAPLIDGWFAVGWLHPDHPYPQGPVAADFLAKLRELVGVWGRSAEALGGGAPGGVHTCEFCGQAIGTGALGVPAGDRLFYAPQMIAHYVERHHYTLPAEFIAAVLACPVPGTPEYGAAVSRFRLGERCA
jgi:hypothetical protein